MPDYKSLYYSMFRACEQAISLLIEAQQQCEEQYLQETDEPVPFPCIQHEEPGTKP